MEAVEVAEYALKIIRTMQQHEIDVMNVLASNGLPVFEFASPPIKPIEDFIEANK